MKQVKCPYCGKMTEYSTSNLFRPFCSERCQTADLGAWAEESYKVPAEENESARVNENSDSPSESNEELPPKRQLN